MLSAEPRDPVLDLIERYHASMKACEAASTAAEARGTYKAKEDQIIAATYGPLLEEIRNNTPPGRRREGAAAALRFAQEQLDWFANPPEAEAMIASALAFLEGRV